jgi:hypothetical protein
LKNVEKCNSIIGMEIALIESLKRFMADQLEGEFCPEFLLDKNGGKYLS